MICAKNKAKGEKEGCESVCGNSLDSVAKEGLMEKVTFQKSVGRDEWVMEIPEERAFQAREQQG